MIEVWFSLIHFVVIYTIKYVKADYNEFLLSDDRNWASKNLAAYLLSKIL